MPEQYKVPQEVETEDTIVGSLTLKQFLKLLTGCGLAYIIYTSFPLYIFFFLGVPVLIFSLLSSFCKIGGQPFEKFLWATISYWFRPQKRVWKKVLEEKEEKIITPKKEERKVPSKKVSKSELEKLAYILDTRGHVKTEGEQEDDELLRLKEMLIKKRSHQGEDENISSLEDLLKKGE